MPAEAAVGCKVVGNVWRGGKLFANGGENKEIQRERERERS